LLAPPLLAHLSELLVDLLARNAFASPELVKANRDLSPKLCQTMFADFIPFLEQAQGLTDDLK
jgi:hypothetical protein